MEERERMGSEKEKGPPRLLTKSLRGSQTEKRNVVKTDKQWEGEKSEKE